MSIAEKEIITSIPTVDGITYKADSAPVDDEGVREMVREIIVTLRTKLWIHHKIPEHYEYPKGRPSVVEDSYRFKMKKIKVGEAVETGEDAVLWIGRTPERGDYFEFEIVNTKDTEKENWRFREESHHAQGETGRRKTDSRRNIKEVARSVGSFITGVSLVYSVVDGPPTLEAYSKRPTGEHARAAYDSHTTDPNVVSLPNPARFAIGQMIDRMFAGQKVASPMVRSDRKR